MTTERGDESQGQQPTRQQVALGDLAVTFGHDVHTLMGAISSAARGHLGLLGQFGIFAQARGELLGLSMRGCTISVKPTMEGITGAMVAFGEMAGVAGAAGWPVHNAASSAPRGSPARMAARGPALGHDGPVRTDLGDARLRRSGG